MDGWNGLSEVVGVLMEGEGEGEGADVGESERRHDGSQLRMKAGMRDIEIWFGGRGRGERGKSTVE